MTRVDRPLKQYWERYGADGLTPVVLEGIIDELARALARTLTDDGLRHMLVERGRQRVKGFPRTAFTLEIARILREVRQMRYA